VVGVADRVSKIAGAVAAATTRHVNDGQFSPGVSVLGDASSPNESILGQLSNLGIHTHEFVGSANG
jgi:hypothetical protein